VKTPILVTCLALSPYVYSGFPVTDPLVLSQMLVDQTERAAQWMKEADQWAKSNGFDVDKIKEMKSQGEHYRSMVEGHFSFEDIINDPILNNITEMEGWRTLYDTVEDTIALRKKFGIKNNDDKFDDALSKYEMIEKFYERTINRNKALTKLLEEFDTADTPSKKADLANAISLEQAKIENDGQMITSLQKIKEHEDDIRLTQESKNKINTLFGEGIPRK